MRSSYKASMPKSSIVLPDSNKSFCGKMSRLSNGQANYKFIPYEPTATRSPAVKASFRGDYSRSDGFTPQTATLATGLSVMAMNTGNYTKFCNTANEVQDMHIDQSRGTAARIKLLHG